MWGQAGLWQGTSVPKISDMLPEVGHSEGLATATGHACVSGRGRG